MNQLSFLDIEKPKPSRLRHGFDGQAGKILRDRGIKKAITHAEDIHDGWATKALDFLYLYAMKHSKFSGEMVRAESKGFLPEPPSLRAWGAILVNAAKRGWIRQVGYIHVENPKAHKANAALWESLI